VLLIGGWWLALSSFAQTISLGSGKTTSLIFPAAIRHIDVGSRDILVQQVREAENILLVKAAFDSFKSTNITAVTVEGQLFCLQVVSGNNTDKDVYCIDPAASANDHLITFEGEPMNLKDLKTYAASILDNSKKIRGIRDSKWDMLATVKGLYIKNDVLFLQLAIQNFSSIDYEVDFIRFFTRDKKTGHRTAVQEIELQPLYNVGNTSKITAYANNVSAFAFKKFTIQDDKLFVIQIGEKNGGRHLLLKVNNSKVLKSIILPSLN
jgi:conjugative transposon TraN protein